MSLFTYFLGAAYIIYGLALLITARLKYSTFGTIIEDYLLIIILLVGGLILHGIGLFGLLYEI